MNTSADPEGLVRHGNERVLRARFNDARFFWDIDQQKKLADRVRRTWRTSPSRPSSAPTSRRPNAWWRWCSELGGDAARRSAPPLLAKCDLTTEMVKEFTELQGVVGGLYARAQGEPEAVWQAIYDHYKPASMEDSIPRHARPGSWSRWPTSSTRCAAASRVGLIPTGSQRSVRAAPRRAGRGEDPGGRQAARCRCPQAGSATTPQLAEFFLDRVRYYFREIRGFKYDEVNAVLAAGWDDLVDVESRLAAIQAVRPTENFEPLAASFKRIRNILQQAQFAGGGEIDAALLEAGPERDLYDAFLRACGRPVRSIRTTRPTLEAIAGLRPAVDLFFDKVLVNAPDQNVRHNRLTLLAHASDGVFGDRRFFGDRNARYSN